MIPVQGQLRDLSKLRSKAEREFGVTLPPDAQSLVDIVSTPGAFGRAAEVSGSSAKVYGQCLREFY